MASSSSVPYRVFISHAGVDKTTIAFPLREKLLQHGITAFVDEMDMPGGTWAEEAMIKAMKTAAVAVVVLSPEFLTREWPMRELRCFLRRSGRIKEPLEEDELPLSAVIPLFYRLSIKDIYQERLYHESRFFEGVANGEPEANIEIVKKLHGFMGVENYANASNETSSNMMKRREDLLNRLCEHVRAAVKRECEGIPSIIPAPDARTDQFRCYYHKVKKKVLSGLVLGFQGSDNEDGPVKSKEADILQAVLDTSNSTEVISIQGMGGVGKSSILQGLSNLDAVKRRYQGGVHLLSLGLDMTRNELIQELCKVIRSAGGEMKSEEVRRVNKFEDVCDIVRSWFSGKEVLFMIDNVWGTAEISSEIIEELLTLHESGPKSKTLFTTRSTEIAAEAEKGFVLDPRGVLGAQCRAILILHSGIKVADSNAEDNRAINTILMQCGGLPLFVRIAGRAVKALSNKSGSGNKGCAAYHRYAANVHLNNAKFLNTPVGFYQCLSDTLETSLHLVEDRKDVWGFRPNLTASEMYRRMSALPKQSRVPMTTLQHLWELQNEDEAFIIAEEFEQIGLATLETEYVHSASGETLRLHDSLHEYSVGETRKHGEETVGHEALLRGYSRDVTMIDGCHEWWSSCIEEDGYIHGNLCRHLLGAGRRAELFALLLSPEWTERQVKTNGVLLLEADLRLGVDAVADEMQDASDEEYIDRERVLRSILDAMTLATEFIASNIVSTARKAKEIWGDI